MKIDDFIDFLNKYKDGPTESGMKKFFKGEVVVSQMEDESCQSANAFNDSGNLDLCVDALSMLTMDDGWALVTAYQSESMRMISISPKIADNWLILNDVKSFNKLGQEKDYAGIIEGHAGEIELHSMEDMTPKAEWGDISIGGPWFDSDDDWGYTYLSRFFQNYLDFNDDNTKAWLVQFTDTGGALPILNWMFNVYDSLFELVGVKV